jgi:hypothetical protein
MTTKIVVESPQPAAVGVVGSVRWGVLCDNGGATWVMGRLFPTQKTAQRNIDESSTYYSHRNHLHNTDRRVVAIVDPAQIVPLASGEPTAWIGDNEHIWYDRTVAARTSKEPIAPLYSGLAQPAQERDV